MDITIHAGFRPHDGPEACLAFYRDVLELDVRSDVGQGRTRWIRGQPRESARHAILLAPPATDPGITDDERRTIAEMMAKGSCGWCSWPPATSAAPFEQIQVGDVDVVQEPIDQPDGGRDCAVRDPAGNLIRIQERR